MKKTLALYCLISLSELILAYICGPHSCEGGLALYFYGGILFLIMSLALPFIKNPAHLPRKVVMAFILALLSALLWAGGFMMGNFRVICKLF